MSSLSKKKRIIITVVAAVVVVCAIAAVAFASWVSSINNQLRGDDTDAVEEVLVEREASEPFYMMLIGSDARSDDASMGARSDTNIVMRVDPENNQITLISIPRDTMITLNGSQAKFNAAYAYEGAAGAVREASALLGVDISHYAEVNFEMLEALVDAVGGVDVEVESTIDDSNAGDVVIEAGTQHLDGEAALVFARSRSYVDGDFTRTYNQRLLVGAILEKVLSLSVTELPGVVEAAAQCVTTDLTLEEIVSLALEFKNADGELTIYSAMVPSTTGTVNGVSYVFTDEETLAEMMEVVEAGGDPSGFTASPTASISTSSSSDGGEAAGQNTSAETDFAAQDATAGDTASVSEGNGTSESGSSSTEQSSAGDGGGSEAGSSTSDGSTDGSSSGGSSADDAGGASTGDSAGSSGDTGSSGNSSSSGNEQGDSSAGASSGTQNASGTSGG